MVVSCRGAWRVDVIGEIAVVGDIGEIVSEVGVDDADDVTVRDDDSTDETLTTDCGEQYVALKSIDQLRSCLRRRKRRDVGLGVCVTSLALGSDDVVLVDVVVEVRERNESRRSETGMVFVESFELEERSSRSVEDFLVVGLACCSTRIH